MNNLIKRAVFGSLYVVAILAALFLENKVLYLVLFSLLSFIAVYEYNVLSGSQRTRPLRTLLDAGAAVYLFVVSFMLIEGPASDLRLLAPYFFYLIYSFVRSIYSDRAEAPNSLARIVLGQVYIALPFVCANLSHLWLNVDGTPLLLLLVFVCIWVNDTGAFIIGSTLGKRPLFPSVSPKKSWEGFFGGLAFSIASAIILGIKLAPESASPVVYGILGAVISVASTWGDLFESMLKRNAGVKDSGRIIPGHGGVLDRIDSFLFALPAALFIYLLAH